jgi:vinculin
MKWNNCINLF